MRTSVFVIAAAIFVAATLAVSGWVDPGNDGFDSAPGESALSAPPAADWQPAVRVRGANSRGLTD